MKDKRWIVTGNGGLEGGILYVVDAPDRTAAMTSAVCRHGWILREIYEHQGDGPEGEAAKIKVLYAFKDVETWEHYQRQTDENDGWMPEIRRGCYVLEAAELEMNVNLHNAVSWP